MVSSKCWAVVSPSPFRFFAALMPPCAHTECDRLTGTIENRSTWPPISAILMTAASPANPPPTTMIFGAAMLLHPRCGGCGERVDNVAVDSRHILEPRMEGVQAGKPHDREQQEECEAEIEQSLLRLVSGNDAPLRGE